MRREKTKLLHKGETTAIGKSFLGKSIKYFSAHQHQNFRTLNICNGAKQKQKKKKQKKKILRKHSLRTIEAVVQRCSVKQEEILKIYRKTTQVPAQVFPCEFCEICKNTYFVEHLQTAAFGIFLLKHDVSNYKISEATTGGILSKGCS